jgi:hypothetical protein
VIAEFGIQDHRQQVRTRAAAGDRMERRRWLCSATIWMEARVNQDEDCNHAW